ncbi:hypothetical protein [Streptomyces sp. P17]|uniref:hypothetical protein n=1 Tax=Streptomyces sp. P17 TaxID=3074716 RepID=UPI0028F45112|nr:hypothetical protein [Streptomyces sp. P17]
MNAANGGTGSLEDDGLQGPPNVYVPQAVPSPDYQEYADPAVAHGWQNAYDETSELPHIPEEPPAAPPPPGEPVDADVEERVGWETHWEPDGGSRTARRARHRRVNRRRALMAAGAVGAASVAALVAGFAFSSDSSSGGSDKKDPAARSATDGSDSPVDPATTVDPSSPASGPSATTPSGAGASAGEAEDDKTSASPSAKPATAAPVEPSTATAREDRRPGRRLGSGQRQRKAGSRGGRHQRAEASTERTPAGVPGPAVGARGNAPAPNRSWPETAACSHGPLT